MAGRVSLRHPASISNRARTASILANGLNGLKPEEILTVPADFFLPMKLEEAISHQRINGFMGVLAHMKHAAVKSMKEK